MNGAKDSFKAASRPTRMGLSFGFAAFGTKTARMRVALFLAAFLCCTAPAHAQTSVEDALNAYALYQSDVTASLRAEINAASDLDAALERAARHDPARMSRGWIAYGALAAAQSPAFVSGVRSRVRAAGRAAVLRQLRRDLTYARRRPPGTDEATQLILSTLAADSARMAAAAQRYQGMAETRLASAWSASASDRETRDQRMRPMSSERRAVPFAIARRLRFVALAETPLSDATAFGGRRFWDAVEGRASPTPPALRWAARPDRIGALDRMLTLAGLVIADATTAEHARVDAALDDSTSRDCLAGERLQFLQCVSVAHDASEDAYCLARHGMTATSSCFAIATAP
jgi:hypothetical protein